MKYYFSVALVIILIFTYNINLHSQETQIPEFPLPEPTGDFAVGTHDFHWIDRERDEFFTSDPNDKRHLMVQVWYPAEPVPDAEPYPYIAHPEEFGEWKGYQYVLHVKTNSVLDAPVSNKCKKYPILIFNHGGGGIRFTSSFQTEEAASHGYILFSIDHTFFNRTTNFPDGHSVTFDAFTFPESSEPTYESTVSSFDYMEKYHFKAWEGDAYFVLDKIEELNKTPGQPFFNMLDLDRIGMYGSSFGGALSAQMCRNDDRIKAGINYDGQLFGDVWEKGTDKPFMYFTDGQIQAVGWPKELIDKIMDYSLEKEQSFILNSGNDRYKILIAGANHMSFSDIVLFNPAIPGEINPKRGHKIINAYTIAFFNKYLLNIDSSLLNSVPAEYPEITFSKKSKHD